MTAKFPSLQTKNEQASLRKVLLSAPIFLWDLTACDLPFCSFALWLQMKTIPFGRY